MAQQITELDAPSQRPPGALAGGRWTVGWVPHLAVLMAAAAASTAIFVVVPSLADAIQGSLVHPTDVRLPSWVLSAIQAYFAFFVLTTVFPFLASIGWMSMPVRQRKGGRSVPFVSVIIPAYNEQKSIGQCLEAATSLEYPAYEVIVVDDGSADLTLPIVEAAPVTSIRLRQNRGKASALNAGIAHARGDLLVFSDSDSRLHPQSLRYLVRHFSDPRIGAVAGNVAIDRPRGLLGRWQALEYILGQTVIKNAQMGCGRSVTVCPGPVSAYRREVLSRNGGFKGRTLAEDFDATLETVAAGYRVAFEPNAVAYTESPGMWRALRQQRTRWFRGILQTILCNRRLLFSAAAGAVGWYWLPFHYLLIGYGGAFLELAVLLTIPAFVLASGHPVELLRSGLAYALIMESLIFAQYIVALIAARQTRPGLAAAGIIIHPYRLFLNGVKVIAVLNQIRGRTSKWTV